jgi:hypothetical protein
MTCPEGTRRGSSPSFAGARSLQRHRHTGSRAGESRTGLSLRATRGTAAILQPLPPRRIEAKPSRCRRWRTVDLGTATTDPVDYPGVGKIADIEREFASG